MWSRTVYVRPNSWVERISSATGGKDADIDVNGHRPPSPRQGHCPLREACSVRLLERQSVMAGEESLRIIGAIANSHGLIKGQKSPICQLFCLN
jgi:hypothetical protein